MEIRRVCEYCGRIFFPRFSFEIYCDTKCRKNCNAKKYRKRKKEEKLKEKENQSMPTCLNCNKPITQPKGSGRPRKFCNADCKSQHRYERNKKEHVTYLIICEECGKMATVKKIDAKFCDKSCHQKHRNKNNPWQALPQTYICEECGCLFLSKNKNVRFCGSKCINAIKTREAIERAKNDVPRHIFPSAGARREYRRRSRIRQQWVEYVDVKVLIERDKGICQICNYPVSLDVERNHPLAATRDHIIAVADGGENSYANSQLAHRHCNNKKNNFKKEVIITWQDLQKAQKSYIQNRKQKQKSL